MKKLPAGIHEENFETLEKPIKIFFKGSLKEFMKKYLRIPVDVSESTVDRISRKIFEEISELITRSFLRLLAARPCLGGQYVATFGLFFSKNHRLKKKVILALSRNVT